MLFCSTNLRIEIRRHTLESPWTYSQLDRRQREIAQEVQEGQPGALLLSEVAPVITVGRRTKSSDLLIPHSELQARGIEIHATDRGGLATYHGPGQWVLFAIDTLENLTGDTRGVRKVIAGLLQVAWKVGSGYVSLAEIRHEAELGVWSALGKFAAVGIHVEERVVLHGLAVNAFKTPTSFYGLRPCGLDLPVDFLLESSKSSKSSNRNEDFIQMGERLKEEALKEFWRFRENFESGV